MRKIDPDSVKTDFAEQIEGLEAFHGRVYGSLTSDADKTLLAEATFMSSAVAWEGFLSDLVVAYINRDSSQFADHLKRSLEAALAGKQRLILDRHCTVSMPRHMTRADILELLDASGSNITFQGVGDLKDMTRVWLVAAHHAKFDALTGPQAAMIAAWVAIRNHVAHRSTVSLERVNACLAASALHGTGLQRDQNKVRQVGAHLKARAPGQNGATRLLTYTTNMKAIAAAL